MTETLLCNELLKSVGDEDTLDVKVLVKAMLHLLMMNGRMSVEDGVSEVKGNLYRYLDAKNSDVVIPDRMWSVPEPASNICQRGYGRSEEDYLPHGRRLRRGEQPDRAHGDAQPEFGDRVAHGWGQHVLHFGSAARVLTDAVGPAGPRTLYDGHD